MEYISKIDKDICTVIDTKTKQEKLIAKADLKNYVLQGNEVCGINAQQDLFYELQIIGNPKTITKSKLGYKPKRVSDSPLKYVINLTEKNDKINPELEENYVSFDAEVYSIRRGFLDKEICNDLLIPKWNKKLPILFTEWNYYSEIAVSEVFIVSGGLSYSLKGDVLYSSTNIKKINELLPILEELGKDLPELEFLEGMYSLTERKELDKKRNQELDKVGGMGWIKFENGEKILDMSLQCVRYPPLPQPEIWYKLKEFIDIFHIAVEYSEIDLTPDDIKKYLNYWRYFSRNYLYANKDICIGQEVPPLWEVVPCLVDIKADDIVLTGLFRSAKFPSAGYLVEKKVSVQKELKNTKSDVIDIVSLDGVWQIDRNCFEDWLHRGRLAISTDLAKRAILGLGSYEMDAEGVLYKITAGRTGDFVVPDGCKKIEKGAILLTDFNCKVKFYDSVKACKTGIFDIAVYNPSGQMLTIDLANVGYKVAYSIGRSLKVIRKRCRFEVAYIFSEEMFVEQAVALMISVGNSVDIGFHLPNNEFAFGNTIVTGKMSDPVIVRKMRDFIDNNGLKLEYSVNHIFGLAGQRANKGV